MTEIVEIPLRQIVTVISGGPLPTNTEISKAKRALIRGTAEPIRLLRGDGYFIAWDSSYAFAVLSATQALRRKTVRAIVCKIPVKRDAARPAH